MATVATCYAGPEAATWNVVTGRDDAGDPEYTPTCDAHLVALLDHRATSNTVLSVYVGGAADIPAPPTQPAPDENLLNPPTTA